MSKSRHPRAVPVQHGTVKVVVRDRSQAMCPIVMIYWAPLNDWLTDSTEVIRRVKVACMVAAGINENHMEIEVSS